MINDLAKAEAYPTQGTAPKKVSLAQRGGGGEQSLTLSKGFSLQYIIVVPLIYPPTHQNRNAINALATHGAAPDIRRPGLPDALATHGAAPEPQTGTQTSAGPACFGYPWHRPRHPQARLAGALATHGTAPDIRRPGLPVLWLPMAPPQTSAGPACQCFGYPWRRPRHPHARLVGALATHGAAPEPQTGTQTSARPACFGYPWHRPRHPHARLASALATHGAAPDIRRPDLPAHVLVLLKGIYPEFQVIRGFPQKIPADLLSYDQIHS